MGLKTQHGKFQLMMSALLLKRKQNIKECYLSVYFNTFIPQATKTEKWLPVYSIFG